MFCPNCGSQCPDRATFCAKCGARVATDAQYAPDSGSYTNYAQQPAKKKRSKLPVAIVSVVIIALVVFFAGMGLGLIPRFWETHSEENTTAENPYIDEKHGEPLDDLAGMTENEAVKALEDAGFKLGEVKTVYSLGDDSNGKVHHTDPIAGTKLADDAPVDLVFVKKVDGNEAREYAKNAIKLSNRLKDDPTFLDGKWIASFKENNDNFGNNCDAHKEVPDGILITIANVDTASENFDVTEIENVPLHWHDNDTSKPRHYDKSKDDDKFSTLADVSDKGNDIVFKLSEDTRFFNYRFDGASWYTKLERSEQPANSSASKPSSKDDKETVHTLMFGVAFYMATDVNLDSEAAVADLIGEDAYAQFETPEGAYQVLADALIESSYLRMTVVEGYDTSGNNVDRGEDYVLSRAESGESENSEESSEQ